MQLFSRRVQLIDNSREVVTLASDIRTMVADKTGRDVGLWMAGFGAPTGAMVYSVRVEGLADLTAATSKLGDDDEYQSILAHARKFTAGPSESQLATPLYGDLGAMPPVGSYAMIASAQIANGMYERALQWGVEMAQLVESLTGLPEMFLAGSFGPFGGVTWIGSAPDAASADASLAKINSDPEYMRRLGESKDLFVQGSGQQVLLTRIG